MRLILALLSLLVVTGGALAQDMLPTIYSDGKSCPGDCDAHVVFNGKHNKTATAFDPSSTRKNPKACVSGSQCTICFSKDDKSCMTVMYRGGGPSVGRFDFTPAFFEKNCAAPQLPKPLVTLCASFQKKFDTLTKDGIYCLADPTNSRCVDLVVGAKAAQDADEIDWQECKEIGEVKFNKKHAGDLKRQRSLGCAYEKKGTGGPNSKGETWRRLLPAACHKATFVGRDGLDCCDANKMSLGGLGRECSNFVVPKS